MIGATLSIARTLAAPAALAFGTTPLIGATLAGTPALRIGGTLFTKGAPPHAFPPITAGAPPHTFPPITPLFTAGAPADTFIHPPIAPVVAHDDSTPTPSENFIGGCTNIVPPTTAAAPPPTLSPPSFFTPFFPADAKMTVPTPGGTHGAPAGAFTTTFMPWWLEDTSSGTS